MSNENVLDNRILEELRSRGVINTQEVVLNTGDLYFAKDVLTNERRIIEASIVLGVEKNESLQENNTKTLLKG
tara:strand:+ start:329 stop:547 length:219 start_codon:yes stop_codon:yes gene_type:complete